MTSQKVRPVVLKHLFRISANTRRVFTSENQRRILGRNISFAIFISFVLALSGCQSALLKKVQMNEFSEELYIDAKLNFAIKHPSNWKRMIIPVSSPEFQADTVIWIAENPHKENDNSGHMLIRSLPRNKTTDLPDLLSSYLTDMPELKSGQAESFDHPAGPALKFLGHDDRHGLLTIAMLGEKHSFIISLDYPSSRFDELLPIFQDIVDSFTEIVSPVSPPEPTIQ